MGRSKEDAHRATFGLAEKCRALRAGGIHDRAHVIHALFERRYPAVAVGQAGAPLVKTNHPAERAQPGVKSGGVWKIPMQLDIPDEPVDHDQIKRASAKYLIGDVNIAVFGVPGFRWRHRLLPVCSEKATGVGRISEAQSAT